MKKQNGFISSSSSVSVTYTSHAGPTTVAWGPEMLRNGVTTYEDGKTWQTTDVLTAESLDTTTLAWSTFESTSYQRIEYFLEAVEKLNSAYSSNTNQYLNLTNYGKIPAEYNLYAGFVDVVITFPTDIRIAGIELINPWINKLSNSPEANYWRYLPSKFKIYKVNTDSVNNALQNVSYETDVAKSIESNENDSSFRPVRYDQLDNDKNLTFLGNYNVNWENTSSYKCFFKYNQMDKASVNLKLNSENTGTATWVCKQIVLRILETRINNSSTNSKKHVTLSDNNNITDIEYKIGKYIKENEMKFGTTYNDKEPSIEQCCNLIGAINISSEKSNKDTDRENSGKNFLNWTFGSLAKRSYKVASDVKFECGINYKLGGIQLLLSPDIFSVAEMKMYNYANRTNNKVFIGEWNKEFQEVEYYGTGIIKTSPYISLSDKNLAIVKWKHNFNIPPKYLDVQMFARFNLDYDSFCVGDVVSNLVNINKEPLTVKLTGTEVQVNITNGIGFTNPETGEFMTFLNGIGVQMDRPGNYDAYNAALAVGAKDWILDYGSNVASIIKGGYPFDIYFVVKRLF